MTYIHPNTAAKWWTALSNETKDRYMEGRTWPRSIPERHEMMIKFYRAAHPNAGA